MKLTTEKKAGYIGSCELLIILAGQKQAKNTSHIPLKIKYTNTYQMVSGFFIFWGERYRKKKC